MTLKIDNKKKIKKTMIIGENIYKLYSLHETYSEYIKTFTVQQ